MGLEVDSYRLVPILANLIVLDTLSEEQRATLDRLMSSYNAGFARLWRDEWMNDSILFALWTHEDGDHLLTGLIEPGGEAHT